MFDRIKEKLTRKGPSAQTVAALGGNALAAAGSEKLACPPRKARLQNGRTEVSPRAKYLAPDPEVISQIEAEGNGKIQYLPARQVTGRDAEYTGEPIYRLAVMEPLCEELLEKYGDRKIALRGILTSVNGTLPGALYPGRGDHDIWDITQTVENGLEQDKPSFNVLVMSNQDTIETAAFSLKYIATYTHGSDMTAKHEIAQNYSDAVFPAVLVYDAALLEATGEDRFTVRPREGVTASDALLEAYVLDRPQYQE